jgi:hypothetical protein
MDRAIFYLFAFNYKVVKSVKVYLDAANFLLSKNYK